MFVWIMVAAAFARVSTSSAISNEVGMGGLDVTVRFFRNGLDLIEAEIIQSKTPYLNLIQETSLQQIAQLTPDYIICLSVLMNVPPHELDTFLDKLLSLMAVHTRLLLFWMKHPPTSGQNPGHGLILLGASRNTYLDDILTHRCSVRLALKKGA